MYVYHRAKDVQAIVSPPAYIPEPVYMVHNNPQHQQQSRRVRFRKRVSGFLRSVMALPFLDNNMAQHSQVRQ